MKDRESGRTSCDPTLTMTGHPVVPVLFLKRCMPLCPFLRISRKENNGTESLHTSSLPLHIFETFLGTLHHLAQWTSALCPEQ